VAFDENLTQFFEVGDFAVEAVIKDGSTAVRTISVIFNDPRQDVAIFDSAVESNLPFALCRTSDLEDVEHGFTMAIGGAVYRIVENQSDGTGVSTVQLRTQS
jgi:hypothetical protein